MSILETGLVALRDRGRLSEITAIAILHGFSDILARLGFGGKAGTQTGPDAPERLRHLLEELGPTFTKLGQILSTRADLLGPEWTGALEKLQSQVQPLPWDVARDEMTAALGQPPEEVFAAITPEPLAAGSIAQVHRARLSGGEEVVIKIRRPGLRPKIEADMRILAHLTGLAEARWPDLARFRPREIVGNLASAMAEELDLAAEGRNNDLIAANLAGLPAIRLPRIFHDYSSETLLVQEFIDGIAPNDRAALQAAGLNGPVLATRGADAFLRMALVDGVFHADPHPGNLRALPGNAVAFIDFGMVGRLGARRREELLALLAGIVDHNGSRVASLLLDWSGEAQTDLAALEAACDLFVARHAVPPLHLGLAVSEFTALARQHDLALPPDLALLFKALITADGVMRGLDPDFDAIKVAAPIVQGEMRRMFGPQALAAQGKTLALDMAGLFRDLPGLFRLLNLRLRQGKLSTEIELKGLDRLSGDITKAATRISVAVITAAFALGLAPGLVQAGPILLGLPLGAWTGMALVAAGLLWTVWPRR
ncbi:ABC1 kinase family protein [Sulfitobacter sp. M21595]|mgnify:CR=1 FL=1|uniref:ABC1 kinase family protein n=1 Tax=Sulfitobacter sp. M21595 TaxID=3368574 RepID=UPI003744FEFD